MANPCLSKAHIYINKINEIALASIGKSLTRDAALSKDIRAKLGEFKERVMDHFGDTDNMVFNEDFVKKVDLVATAQITDVLNQMSAATHMKDFTESILGIYKTGVSHSGVKSLPGLFDSIFGYVERTAGSNVDKSFGNSVDRIVADVNVSGASKNPDAIAKGKELFLDSLNGGARLDDHILRKGSDPREATITALKFGHSNIDELNTIGVIYKGIQKETSEINKNNYPTYKGEAEDSLLLPVDVAKIGDPDDVVKFLLEKNGENKHRVNLAAFLNKSDDDFLKMGVSAEQMAATRLTSIVENMKSPGTTNSFVSKDPFSNNQLIFRDEKAEIEFYNQYADTRGSVVFQAFRNQLKQRKRMARHALLGPNPFVSLEVAKETIAKSLGLKSHVVERAMAPYKDSFTQKEFPDNLDDETEGIVYGVFNKFVSLGLIGRSALRNLVSDNTFHASIVKNMRDGTSATHQWAKQTSGLLNLSAGNRAKIDELAHLLEGMGISIKGGYHTMYSGMLNVTDGFWSGKLPISEKSNKALNKLERGVGKTADIVSTWSGSDWTLRSARSMAAQDTIHTIQKALKSDWKDVDVVLQRELLSAGINEKMFGVFKRLSFAKGRDGQSLGFINFNSLTNKDLSPLLKGATTVAGARRLVKDRYVYMMSEMMDGLAPTPNYRSRMGKHDKLRGHLSRALHNFVYKFGSITQSAHLGMFRTARNAAGLDPNTLTASLFSPLAANFAMLKNGNIAVYGKLVTQLAAGGMLMQWTGDLVEGRDLRAVTPKNLLLGLGQTELGGYFTTILTNAFWNEGLVPDPTVPFIKAAKDLTYGLGKAALNDDLSEDEKYDKMLDIFRRSHHRVIPPAGIWGIKAGTNRAIRQLLMFEPYNSYQKNRMEEDSLSKQFGGD